MNTTRIETRDELATHLQKSVGRANHGMVKGPEVAEISDLLADIVFDQIDKTADEQSVTAIFGAILYETGREMVRRYGYGTVAMSGSVAMWQRRDAVMDLIEYVRQAAGTHQTPSVSERNMAQLFENALTELLLSGYGESPVMSIRHATASPVSALIEMLHLQTDSLMDTDNTLITSVSDAVNQTRLNAQRIADVSMTKIPYHLLDAALQQCHFDMTAFIENQIRVRTATKER